MNSQKNKRLDFLLNNISYLQNIKYFLYLFLKYIFMWVINLCSDTWTLFAIILSSAFDKNIFKNLSKGWISPPLSFSFKNVLNWGWLFLSRSNIFLSVQAFFWALKKELADFPFLICEIWQIVNLGEKLGEIFLILIPKLNNEKLRTT